jgi:hypothetical protein
MGSMRFYLKISAKIENTKISCSLVLLDVPSIFNVFMTDK